MSGLLALLAALLPMSLAAPLVAGELEVPHATERTALAMRAEAAISDIVAKVADAPALAVGLAALLAMPVLVLVGTLSRMLSARPETPDISSHANASGVAPLPGDACLTAGEGAAETKYRVGRHPLRIGRATDNDVRLVGRTVHRYHALIERDEAGAVTITDLSGAKGNGVYVNSRRVRHASLRNGDSIALGAAVLRIASGASAAAAHKGTLAQRLAADT